MPARRQPQRRQSRTLPRQAGRGNWSYRVPYIGGRRRQPAGKIFRGPKEPLTRQVDDPPGEYLIDAKTSRPVGGDDTRGAGIFQYHRQRTVRIDDVVYDGIARLRKYKGDRKDQAGDDQCLFLILKCREYYLLP